MNYIIPLSLILTTNAFAYDFSGVEKTFNLPQGLLSAVCWVESSHREKVISYNDGKTDSIGLCQLKLATAQWLGYNGDVLGLLDAKTNMFYAAKYLNYQLRRYNQNLAYAISAYNMGSVKFNKNKQIINRVYVNKVTKRMKEQNVPKQSPQTYRKAA